jgi:hypothetical protein
VRLGRTDFVVLDLHRWCGQTRMRSNRSSRAFPWSEAMARDEDEPVGGAAEQPSGPWLADYSARVAMTGEETMRAGTSAADRWARRSLDDQEWTVDSVTADVIADWEEMTPLVGRWLDLWLEAVQQAMKGGDRVSDDGRQATGSGQPDLIGLVTRRLEEYVQLWEGAASRLRDSSYRSEHLLDDWFRFWGNAVRDMTAGAALLWDAGGAPRPGADRDSGADEQ